MLDWDPDSPCDASSFEVQEETEVYDALRLFKPKDPAWLTFDDRQFLLSQGVEPEEWQAAGYDCARLDSFSTVQEEPEKSRDDILVEEAEALKKQFGPNGSVLTPEQRKALYKRYLSMHLKTYGLQSPPHYPYFEELSEPISVEDRLWPGVAGDQVANRLKRGYIDPEDLTDRLGKLKPSDNFELRKPPYPPMEWTKSPVYEDGYTESPPEPMLFLHQVYAVTRQENVRHLRRSYMDLQNEVMEPWKEAMRDLELSPTPDLHLLSNVGHSPNGTLFPRYLIKGLRSILEEANSVGSDNYQEEYKIAGIQKEEAINRWKRRNPAAILPNVPIIVRPRDLPANITVPLYKAWPADLMEELREIDREAVRSGKRRYNDLLRETEKKMQNLIKFWKDCGAITGHRSPPLSWWLAPVWGDQHSAAFSWPPRLVKRLDAIKAESMCLNRHKEVIIEISRWKEAIMKTGSEPASPGTPFSESLLDELNVVWETLERYEPEKTEDAMIAKISQWRKSKEEQRAQPPRASLAVAEASMERTGSEYPRPETSAHETDSDLALVQEAMGLRAKRSRRRFKTSVAANDRDICKTRLRPRVKTMEIDKPTSWRDRLRPRHDVLSCARTKAAKEPSKPKGINKQRGKKTSKKARQVTRKSQTTASETNKPGLPKTRTSSTAPPSSIPRHSAEPATSKLSRRPPSSQPRGRQERSIQKSRSGQRKQVRRVPRNRRMPKYEQGLLGLLTPPQ